MVKGAVPGSKSVGARALAVDESLPPLKPGTASARVPGTKTSSGYFTEGTDNSFYQAKPWSVRRPITSSFTPGSYAAERAVHRASKKGYTAGRMTLNPEPPVGRCKLYPGLKAPPGFKF